MFSLGGKRLNYKNDASIYKYLNSIDSGPLLTREQEEELIKNVEVYQKQILQAFIMSDYSRHELKMYLQSLESSGENIIDLSKKLDEESDKDLVKQTEDKFKSIIIELQNPPTKALEILLDDVSLTGTIIHGVVTEIKKKHSKIVDAEFQVNQIIKFFPDFTIHDIMKKLEISEHELRLRLKTEHSLNEVRVNNKINEWKQILSDFRSLESIFPKAVTFADVKHSYRIISSLEVMAQKYKNELIQKNLRLVVSRAKLLLNRGLDFEDLIQEGNMGLIKAVDKFDSSRKTKISTYATWWIDQSMRRAISNKGKTVRVPTHIEWIQTNINKLIHNMTGKLGRPPTLQEIAAEAPKHKINIDLKGLEELQTRAQHEYSLEDELQTGQQLIEVIRADNEESPLAAVEKKLLQEKIREILATLPPRVEKIIRLRYGIGEVPDGLDTDDEGMTLQNIAEMVGITKQGVRVVECAAFKKMRKRAKRLL